jgi:hypothetical protein
MKIILSRKGFDSGIGGVPSPILPSGELYSLPIPESSPGPHAKRYDEIRAGEWSMGTMINDLSGGKVKPGDYAHLDPDLNALSIPRQDNWRPVFGQARAAEKHLQNKGIQAGDIFVFFGWFRQVELLAGRFGYINNAPHLHVIFGWLQVEQRLPSAALSAIPPWAREHPHCKRQCYGSPDSIYLSNRELRLPGIALNKPGAGVFRRFAPGLCLTAPGRSRSIWQLPSWFDPDSRASHLSYHGNPVRWNREGESVFLRSAGRGQEFVLDCQDYPEAIPWLAHLLCVSN